ncbi:MAG: hypothetical protein ACJA0Q_000017 [Saprospiraceae bacterium]|jgi:uncharacterized protein (TIGR00255 family)
MTYSMTGFGKAQFTFEDKSYNIEIKCLNSKQQDVTVRMPSKFKSKELELRKLIIGKLTRGKIEFSMYYSAAEGNKGQKINQTVFKNYVNQLSELTGKDPDGALIAAVLKMPEVMSAEKEEFDENEWLAVLKGLESALIQVLSFRAAEGKNLRADLDLRINNIEQKLEEVIDRDKLRTLKIKEKLNSAVHDIHEKLLDKNRFEQELIYYLEKMDITEEKVRLKSHTTYFHETIELDGEKGKKLAFISQEIGREINTIGSKANDSEMQKMVVEMKDELEKIKEQLLNIL